MVELPDEIIVMILEKTYILCHSCTLVNIILIFIKNKINIIIVLKNAIILSDKRRDHINSGFLNLQKN